MHDAQPLGEGCLLWTLGATLDAATSARVLRAYRQARKALLGRVDGVLDVVPAYASLAVHVDPLVADRARIADVMTRILATSPAAATEDARATRHTLRVRYDGEDIAHVAAHAGLAARDVARLHAAPVYTVAMIGFRPHFPYLLGLDPRLATPRRAEPRTRVRAGAVAIGGAQTGVYPSESPGGWHIVGYTDPAALRAIAPGDEVVFEEAS